MIHLLLALTALQAPQTAVLRQEADEPAYRSQTFDNWRREGKVELVRQVRRGARSVDLWVHRGEFSPAPYLAAAKVNAEEFYGEVLSVFEWALPHFERGMDLPARPCTIVIVDDAPESTVSAALRGTTTMLCEVRAWHRRLSTRAGRYGRESQEDRFRREMVYVSASHEIYHTYNYDTDPGEVRYMRELSAMIWESVALVRRYGGDLAGLRRGIAYCENVIRDRQISVEGDFLTRYEPTATRLLAYLVADRVIRQQGLAGVERLSRSLLLDVTNGRFSLDWNLNQAGLPFTSGDVIEDLRLRIRNLPKPEWRGEARFGLPSDAQVIGAVTGTVSALYRVAMNYGTGFYLGLQRLVTMVRARATASGSGGR